MSHQASLSIKRNFVTKHFRIWNVFFLKWHSFKTRQQEFWKVKLANLSKSFTALHRKVKAWKFKRTQGSSAPPLGTGSWTLWQASAVALQSLTTAWGPRDLHPHPSLSLLRLPKHHMQFLLQKPRPNVILEESGSCASSLWYNFSISERLKQTATKASHVAALEKQLES